MCYHTYQDWCDDLLESRNRSDGMIKCAACQEMINTYDGDTAIVMKKSKCYTSPDDVVCSKECARDYCDEMNWEWEE